MPSKTITTSATTRQTTVATDPRVTTTLMQSKPPAESYTVTPHAPTPRT